MDILVHPQNKTQFARRLRTAPAKTFYSHAYDKIFARYRVSWKDKSNKYTLKALLRFTDFEGHRPKITSLRYIIPALKTYFESRNRFILRNPVPFIVFEAINKLDEIISPGAQVLEFGSGNSTLWFLGKKCSLTSIEHDTTWCDVIRKHIQSDTYSDEVLNQFNFHNSEKENSWKLVDDFGDESFDIILVDGANEFNNRNMCIEKALPKLKKGGWMVLDNSDHPNNWPGGLYLDSKFDRIRFTGFAAMGLYVSQTSFWQKK